MTDDPAFNYEPKTEVGESIQELLDEPPRPVQDEFAAVSQNDEDEVEFILPESPPPDVQNIHPRIDLQGFTPTEKSNIKWKRSLEPHQVDLPEFTPADVDNEQDAKLEEPIKYFKRYLGDEFFELATHFTNQYAMQRASRIKTYFKPTCTQEMKVLFAHHIMMGVYKFSRLEMYYNRYGHTFFKDSLTERRFSALRTNLHLVDVLVHDPNSKDKLWKVQPIIDAVRKRLWEVPLEENVCIDEQMIPFKGLFGAKQYVKGKPSPWGIKVFCLNGKSGMPYDFIVYQGSTTPLNQQDQKIYGFGSTVVLNLADRIPRDSVGHKLYFDNYFPSYKLFEALKFRNIYAAGTIRINRFASPKVLNDKELKIAGRGSSSECVSRDESVIVTRWFDSKPVNLASNFIGIGSKDTVTRNGGKLTIERPEVVKRYNECMGGVDKMDQLLSYYRISIRAKKWTQRFIMHFVDFALVASWLEYKKDFERGGYPKKEFLDSMHFRQEVAYALNTVQSLPIPFVDSPKSRGRPPKRHIDTSMETNVGTPKRKRQSDPMSHIRYDQLGHIPVFEDTENQHRCMGKNCPQKTNHKCIKCKVFLCIKRKRNCFQEYHVHNRT